jgi:hypothetical protein
MQSLTARGNAVTFQTGPPMSQDGGGVGQFINKISKTANKIGSAGSKAIDGIEKIGNKLAEKKILSKALSKLGTFAEVAELPGGAALSKLGEAAKQAGAGKKMKKRK